MMCPANIGMKTRKNPTQENKSHSGPKLPAWEVVMQELSFRNCVASSVRRMRAAMGRSNQGNAVRATLRACAAMICLSVMASVGHAQTGAIVQLFSFPCSSQTGNCLSGTLPDVLIQASDGNFYGAAEVSGELPQGGTIFKITPGGQFTRLFTFPAGGSGNYLKGSLPATALVEATMASSTAPHTVEELPHWECCSGSARLAKTSRSFTLFAPPPTAPTAAFRIA